MKPTCKLENRASQWLMEMGFDTEVRDLADFLAEVRHEALQEAKERVQDEMNTPPDDRDWGLCIQDIERM